jgi:hypothetical protein
MTEHPLFFVVVRRVRTDTSHPLGDIADMSAFRGKLTGLFAFHDAPRL